MSERSITLTLRLTDERRKETFGVVERPIFVSGEESEEKSSSTISDILEDVIEEVKQACEKQSLMLLDKDALAQELPILILVSVLKEDVTELSHDVIVASSEGEDDDGD